VVRGVGRVLVTLAVHANAGDGDSLVGRFALLGLKAGREPIADARGGGCFQKSTTTGAMRHDDWFLDSHVANYTARATAFCANSQSVACSAGVPAARKWASSRSNGPPVGDEMQPPASRTRSAPAAMSQIFVA